MKADEPAIVAALRAGTARTALARQYGIAQSTVSRIAKRNGLPRKYPGRAGGWPDCPAHLRADYQHLLLRKKFRAAEARAILERVG